MNYNYGYTQGVTAYSNSYSMTNNQTGYAMGYNANANYNYQQNQQPQAYPNSFGYGFQQNPMAGVTNALPQQNVSVNGMSSKYIAPAEKPLTSYIPPPKLPHRFPFDPQKKEAYANFYSILSTMEALEEETCNGIIPQSLRDELFKGLFEQYNRVSNVLGFKQQQEFKEFALASDLICSYTFATLFKVKEQEKQSQAANKAILFFGIGSDLTDLSDLCENPSSMYGQCQQKTLEIRTKFRKLNSDCNTTALQILNKWVDLFMNKRTNDVLTQEERKTLASDLNIIRSIVASASS